MDIKKNLIEIKECPICKNSKFTNLGKTNNLHEDLKNLFDLLECKNCKHWFFSKIIKVFRYDNYIQIGSLIYLIFIFLPLIPSGAFFSDHMLTLFVINLSILYSSNKKLNIFNS